MTPNERVFADEYIRTRNATRAYLKAYPNCKKETSARQLGYRLLTKVHINEYIEAELERLHNSAIADAAEIMVYYTSVMRGETGEVALDNRGEEHQLPARISDRSNAAERLSRMLGVDKKADTANGGGGVTIVDDI